MSAGGTTAAAGRTPTDIAMSTGGRLVTTVATETLITAVLDENAAHVEAALTGILVVLEWRPPHPNGPLPDLVPILEQFLPKGPAAVFVSPSRSVNPPPKAVAAAERGNVSLIWNRSGGSPTEIEAQITELLTRSAVQVRHSHSVPDSMLAIADDLPRLLDAVTLALGGEARLSIAPTRPTQSGHISFPLLENNSGNATLDIHREVSLSADERRLLTALAPVFRLHVALSDTTADDRTTERARNLKHILGEDLLQREVSLRKARRLSMFPRHPVVCLGIEPFGVRVDIEGLHELRIAMMPVAVRFDADAIVVVNAGTVVVMMKATTQLDSFVRALYRSVQVPLAVGVSEDVDDPRSYPSSFRQAERAVSVGRRVGAINRVTRYRDLGVLGLLYQLPEHARRSFVSETLGSVADSTPESLDQRRVLRALRATDCNVTESARSLFVHPNTLRSRISRIEQIVGSFMAEPEHRMTVFTALAMFSLDSSDSE
ncbi:hypothetical protein ABH922_000121 [Rhodococcus sp. 27YEA15]|uniref:PucR family transcriptional regulator n=1 Tax=Rhodococcus sp. 27YEA15 TaxID=3156259 RepID=UPI003C7EA1F4